MTEIAKLIFIQMCNTLGLLIRKEVEHCKPDLMNHPSRNWKESGAESNVSYGSPKFKGFHREKYQALDQILFSSYFVKECACFLHNVKNMPAARLESTRPFSWQSRF